MLKEQQSRWRHPVPGQPGSSPPPGAPPPSAGAPPPTRLQLSPPPSGAPPPPPPPTTTTQLQQAQQWLATEQDFASAPSPRNEARAQSAACAVEVLKAAAFAMPRVATAPQMSPPPAPTLPMPPRAPPAPAGASNPFSRQNYATTRDRVADPTRSPNFSRKAIEQERMFRMRSAGAAAARATRQSRGGSAAAAAFHRRSSGGSSGGGDAAAPGDSDDSDDESDDGEKPDLALVRSRVERAVASIRFDIASSKEEERQQQQTEVEELRERLLPSKPSLTEVMPEGKTRHRPPPAMDEKIKMKLERERKIQQRAKLEKSRAAAMARSQKKRVEQQGL
jgi:hypothetical protein